MYVLGQDSDVALALQARQVAIQEEQTKHSRRQVFWTAAATVGAFIPVLILISDRRKGRTQ